MPFIKDRCCLFILLLCTLPLRGQEAPESVYDPVTTQQLSLDIQINTTSSERAPVLSGDGKTLFFVRKGYTNNIGEANESDIWASYLQPDGAWSRSIHLPAPINNSLLNRVLAADVNGEALYLEDRYQNNNPGGIALSVRKGRSWSKPQSMFIEDFIPSAVSRPHYSVDVTGNFLLLAVDLPGGAGKRDLYVCFRKDELNWTKPLRLGDALNSPEEESRAVLAADGRTLYFTSEGHGGYGGLDWFYTYRQDDSWTMWSEPQQLGKSINTAKDDEFMTVSYWGETAIITRIEKDGTEDLMIVLLPENLRPKPMTLVTGKVVDARTRQAVKLPVAYLLPQVKGKEALLKTKQDGRFSLLTPSGQAPGGYICPKGYFVTSNVFASAKEALQEEDVDPFGGLAAANMNPLYFQREAEIENLSLRLLQVDIELQEATQMRAAWKQKLEAARQADPRAWKPDDDPELQALKHRYQEYLNRQRDTIIPPMQVMIPPKPDEEIEESVIPASFDKVEPVVDELEEMRRRLRNHYQSLGIAEKKEEDSPQYLWENTPPPFEELSRSVHDSLRKELYPQVRQQVSRELIAEILSELAHDPNAMPEQEAALREQIRQGLTASLMSHAPLPEETRPEPLKDWERLFAADIKKAVSTQVRMELAHTMRQDIKRALRNEATFLLKKEQSSALRKALGEKVIQQIREEEKKIAELSEDMPPVQVPQTIEEDHFNQPQLQTDIVLMPIEEGQVVLLNNVFFEHGSAKLKPVSYAELDNVLEMLRRNPGMVVEIGTHTHGGISHAVGMQLTAQRARVIAEYLISKGIPKENVPYRGYGKMIPIASNDTPEGRIINQRVELNIIKLK